MAEINRRQFAACLVAVVLVVLIGGRALRADAGGAGAVPPGGLAAQGHQRETSAGADVRGTSGASGSAGGGGVEVTEQSERVLVHVAGAVRRPGVYELASGARVRDALAEAGGGRASADLDALNLAAKVADGQQVLILRRGRGAVAGQGASGGSVAASSRPAAAEQVAPPAAGTGPGATGATVNVNQADATQLEVLDGVGPAIAAKIVDWRLQNGPFRTVDDLAQVPGIGPKKLEALRAQATT